MRPHNSGHWTTNGPVTSQFEQHLRAVLTTCWGDPPIAPVTVMANVLGAAQALAMAMDEGAPPVLGRIRRARAPVR